MSAISAIRTSAVGLALATLALLPAAAPAREHLTGEQELAKLLEGRSPAKPVDCIQLRDVWSTQIIDRTAIVYNIAGTLYVNRPSFPDMLDSDAIMVTKTWGSQLCRLDMVSMRDRSMPGMMHASIGLNDFVPYAKPPKAKAAAGAAVKPAAPAQ